MCARVLQAPPPHVSDGAVSVCANRYRTCLIDIIYAYRTMGVFGLAHPLFLFYIFIHLYEYFYNQIIFVPNAFVILYISCLRI